MKSIKIRLLVRLLVLFLIVSMAIPSLTPVMAANSNGELTAKIEYINGVPYLTLNYTSGNNSIKEGIFEVLSPDKKTVLLKSPVVPFNFKAGTYSFKLSGDIPENAVIRMTENKTNNAAVAEGVFAEGFKMPVITMTVNSPANYQKISRFLDVDVTADIEGDDVVDSIAAIIGGKTIELADNGVSYACAYDFFTAGVTNQKIVDMEIVLTSAKGQVVTESYKLPYIFSGSVLSYFTDAGQLGDFSNGGEWDCKFAGIGYDEVIIDGDSLGLFRCDFEATNPISGWQEIKPVLHFDKYNLAGVQKITYDVYLPYYSTTGGTTNAATNRQNSTWNLGSKIVLDGGVGYLEIPGFGSAAFNSNTYSSVTGPDKDGTGTAAWRKRSVSIDVSTLNLNDFTNITLGLVLGYAGNRPTFDTPLYIGNIQFVSEEFVPREQIYDYFDGYLGDTGWFNHLNEVENAVAEIDPAYAQFGTNGLSLSAGAGGGSIAINSRATITGNALNWNNTAAYTNFYFWVKPDGTPGQTLTIDITGAGGAVYSASAALKETSEYYRVNIPFTDFTDGAENFGTAANRGSISKIKFALNTGSVWLDHIYAHKFVAEPNNGQAPLDTAGFKNLGGFPIDREITPEAASLFMYLQNVMHDPDKVMFGHQHSTTSGLTVTNTDGYQSDIKAGVNDYPAVIGFDSMTFIYNDGANAAAEAARAIIAAKELGAIVTLASHLGNPYTGGGYNSSDPQTFGANGVLVPGSESNKKLAEHFELVAEFLLILQDAGVPVIYRPWHEIVLSGNFFWWHSATAPQYRELWKWTVEFLEEKGVHNTLYSYSPNTASAANIVTLYTEGPSSFYPGDAYVDVFGYDTYTTNFTTNNNSFVNTLNALYNLANDRNKIMALTETGPNADGSAPSTTYYPTMLNALMSGNARYAAYVLTWTNGYYVPCPEFGNTPENAAFASFVDFYNDPRTVFAGQTGGYAAITGLKPDMPPDDPDPDPDPEIPAPYMIEDFEGYANTGELRAKWENPNTSTGESLSLSLESENKNSGNYAMAYSYTYNASGWVGIQNYSYSLDLSAYDTISMWLKGTTDGENIMLQIQAGDIFYEFPGVRPTAEGGVIEISLKRWTVPGWESDEHKTIPPDLSKVTAINLFANPPYSGVSYPFSSLIYVDDICAIKYQAPPPEELTVFDYDFEGVTTDLPTPTAASLPSSWRGFNLLNLFNVDNMSAFSEKEFEMMAEWGFNFVRLPMDYRCWIIDGDWDVLNERVLKEIDRAVEYGIKHDIHVDINFHRAPGYTVATPAEAANLWSDGAAQAAFANMWGEFAKRYKNVPNEYLSFNLVNEPPDMNENTYTSVMKMAADAIWAQDPGRLIIADGLNYATKPSNQIKDYGMAQAARGYQPFNLTHYRAEWVDGSENYPLPVWPVVVIPNHIYSATKVDPNLPSNTADRTYRIEHDFTEDYNLDINIGIISTRADVVVKADGNTVFERSFICDANDTECTEIRHIIGDGWDAYQNIYNKDYRAVIPAGTKTVTIEMTQGDWMTVNDMKFTTVSGGGKAFSVTPNTDQWGAAIPPIKVDADGTVVAEGSGVQNKAWLEEYLGPWKALMANGGGAMVGEWGAYNKTPHDVVLRWMKDNLDNFQDAGMGWALWNFADAFGIMNSGRSDVAYESYKGYNLDREMLELLLEYVK